MSIDRTAALSKLLPPSLGSLFGQPVDPDVFRSTLPNPPGDLPGAFSAPELCCIVDQYVPQHLPGDALAEVKIDGIRCLYIAGRLWTREGSPFEAAEHCLWVLRDLEADYGKPMFFDGEYVEDGGLESTIAAFRRREGNGGCLWLFDAVPFDEWQSGKHSRRPLCDRKAALRTAMLRVTGGKPLCPVGYVEHVRPVDAKIVEEYAQNLWRQGFEGLVVKSARSLYVRKRTCDWMKVKLRTVSRLVVVDVLGCTRGDRMEAKALLVRLPAIEIARGRQRPVAKPVRVPVPPGGLADTIWRNRGAMVNGFVDIEHAGFTGGGNPRDPIIKSVQI